MRRPERLQGCLPIGAYALIGNGTSGALVGADGSIDWLCWPRFDGPSLFGRILDPRAGCFSLTVEDHREVRRRYVPGTGILETVLEGPSGSATITDLMNIELDDAGHLTPGDLLIRSLRCTGGEIEVALRYAPRFDYGRHVPTIDPIDGGVSAIAPHARADLRASIPLQVGDGEASARTRLRTGERLDAITRWAGSPPHAEAATVDQLLDQSERAWRRWSSELTYEGPWGGTVAHSAVVLKLLDYWPTGAMIAAPTTSLPERIGGVRNWDYRYTWVRDAAFAVYALRHAGSHREANAFLDWVFTSMRCRPEELQVMYRVDGGTDLHELELGHLAGYRGSRPVRIGNAAATQHQHDIVAELLDCFHQWRRQGGDVTPAMWQCVRAIVDAFEHQWRRPDAGIWEVRRAPRRFTYSAASAAIAFDRAIRAAEDLSLRAPLGIWRTQRELAVRDVIEGSWSEEAGAFTQAIGGGGDLDASLLALPIRRVVPADHPRMTATIDAIRSRLDAGGGLLWRYDADDGVPGDEGAFLICSFWMVDCLCAQGRLDEAGALFEQLLGYANDVGLLAEEVDPDTGAALGNFPQGLSHIGVIAAAANLARGSIPPAA